MYKLNWNMKNLPLLVEGLHMGAYIYIFDMKGEHMDSKDKNENSHFPDDLSLCLYFGAALSFITARPLYCICNIYFGPPSRSHVSLCLRSTSKRVPVPRNLEATEILKGKHGNCNSLNEFQ